MAPLPQNNTGRLFIDYITGNQATSIEHTMQFRFPLTTTIADAPSMQARVLAFLSGITAGNLRVGWRVIRARYQARLTDFSVPVTLTAGLAAFAGTSTASFTQQREAVEWTFQARDLTTGRRNDVSVYGITIGFPDAFRIPATPASWIDNAINGLVGGTGEPLVSIAGSPLVWYGYVNANYNSYWERRIRTG